MSPWPTGSNAIYGAHVTLVDGLISDCARIVAERKKQKEGWFDVSTTERALPRRRQKDHGLRSRRATRLALPQGIIYPTGGGVGMIGMWKAFEEMEALGWIGSERPK